MRSTLFFLYLILTEAVILNIACNKAKVDPNYKEIYGAWVLYAMNFNYGDSTLFKANFQNKLYYNFLSIDMVPLKKDTLSNKNIHISYIWKDGNGFIPFNFLTFHGIDFDSSNNIIKIHADDGTEILVGKDYALQDEALIDFIKTKKIKKPSDMLMKGFNMRINN